MHDKNWKHVGYDYFQFKWHRDSSDDVYQFWWTWFCWGILQMGSRDRGQRGFRVMPDL